MRLLPLLVVATLLSYPVGLLIGSAWLLPVLNAAPAYALMASRLTRGDREGAVAAMLIWALALAVFGTIFLRFWPGSVEGRILLGREYRDEMFLWIKTGVGREGDLRLFLPQHLLHLLLFVVLSLATASTVSILMGAALMNFMAVYVGSLGRAGVPLWAVVLLGWQPYAICRVAAYCVLGAVLAEPLLSRLRPYPYAGLAAARRYLLWAAGGILVDWVLKASIAPLWGLWLRPLLP